MRLILLFISAVVLAINARAPAEEFDLLSFTPPKEWKKETKSSVVIYTVTDERQGTFCQVALYASRKGSGGAPADFSEEWRGLVEKTFQVKEPGQMVEQDWSGDWKLRIGSAPVDTGTIKFTATLYVYSGHQKVFSVMVNRSSPSWDEQVKIFLGSLKLKEGTEKAKSPSKPESQIPEANPSPSIESEPGSFGAIQFAVPNGWKVVSRNDSFVALSPNRLDAGESLSLFLLKSIASNAAIEKALEASWNEALQMLQAQPEYDAGKFYRESLAFRTPEGRPLLYGEGRYRSNDALFDMTLYAIQLDGAYARVLAVGRILPQSIAYPPTSALHNPAFKHAIPDFVLKLKFKDQKSVAPASPPLPAKGIAGLWAGISMFGGLFKTTYAYFYPDGKAYFASRMPLNGFEGLERDADALLTPGYWGTYSFDGESGMIEFQYRGKDKFPLVLQGDKLTITTTGTPHKFARLDPVDGIRLQGTYEFDLLTGEKPTLSFTQEARFTDRGLIKVMDHWIYPYRLSDQPGEGTYEIKNFTILFHYGDGRMFRLPFSGLVYNKGELSPAELGLGSEDHVAKRR